jgi:hypothetical protein
VEHAWENQVVELKKLIPELKEQKLLNALNIRGACERVCVSERAVSVLYRRESLDYDSLSRNRVACLERLVIA